MNKNHAGHVIRVSREFNFEMAHALDSYKGECKNIHGHSYKLTVTIKGSLQDMKTKGEEGMVMDFKKLKEIVYDLIIKAYDHTLVLKRDSRVSTQLRKAKISTQITYVDFQPTCENLLLRFVDILFHMLPKGIILCKANLRETSKTMAEWCLEDNQ